MGVREKFMSTFFFNKKGIFWFNLFEVRFTFNIKFSYYVYCFL